jgi:hypothetical protein
MARKFLDPSKGDNQRTGALIDSFEGNIMFSSLNQMNFEQPTRKDDLDSLCYLLLYLLNDSKFPIE